MTVPPMPAAADGPGQPGQFDVYSQLLKNRIVMLGTDVNDDIAICHFHNKTFNHLMLKSFH